MATRIVSDTSLTAVADAIREKGGTSSSLTFPDGFVDAIEDIETGGGGGGVVKPSDVNFIDYDGTILYSYSAAEAQALTELPANPSHEGLISQGWNWSLADMKAQVTAIGGCDIGQMYITDDNKTRLYCHFMESTKNPYLTIKVTGTVIVDWGDGSTNTLTGTNFLVVATQHIYASAGDYVISLDASNGTIQFYGGNLAIILRSSNSVNPQNIDRPYAAALKKIELGNNVVLADNAFYGTPIETVTIPKNITSTGTNVFRGCFLLKSITIPDGMTSLSDYFISSCYSLVSVSIPKSVTVFATYVIYECRSLKRIELPYTLTSMGTRSFATCYSLKSIVFPNGMSEIPSYAFSDCLYLKSVRLPNELTAIAERGFYYCYSFKTFTIPDTVTSIGAQAFFSCSGITEYHLKATTPPSLANTNAFNNIASTCKIYVPYSADHSVLNAYKSATNWSIYASKMVEEAA